MPSSSATTRKRAVGEAKGEGGGTADDTGTLVGRAGTERIMAEVTAMTPPALEPVSEPELDPHATRVDPHATRDATDVPVDHERAEPTRIGRYTIVRRLGAGGMGTVWSAYDDALDRRVAIKVLVADRGADSRGRMLREAKALARLNHPNVVQVFEVGELGDDVYLAMEYVVGESLHTWLEQPRTFAAILDAFLQAGRGLEAVHGARLVHRDVKPQNVVVGTDGRVRLIDFGIARLAADETNDASAPIDLDAVDTSLDRLTRTGQFVGTPAFMAPEQLRGLPVDARADQFGFCVSLFRAAYGTAPFAGDKVGALALNVFSGNVVDPGRVHGVPPTLLPILRRGLEVEPQARFADMRALLEALEALQPRRGRGTRLAIAAAAIAGAGLTGAALLWSDETCAGAEAAIGAVWNDARDRSIGTDFTDGGAASTWNHARTHLVGFVDVWTKQHRDACEVHRRGEQSATLLDRRMACLDESKRELDALLRELEQFDASLVPRVVTAIADLPSPSRCADTERLERAASTEPPPAIATRANELFDIVERAQAQERAGRVLQARAALEPVVAEIDALGWAPLAMALHETLARLDLDEGRLADAEPHHLRSFHLAVAHHDDFRAMDTAIALAINVGVQQGRFADADAWVAVADAWVERNGEVPLDRALWQHAVAGIRERQGRLDEAESLLESAAATLATLDDGSGARHLATVYNELGFVYRAQKRIDDAEQAYLTARDHWLEFYGRDHPTTTDPLNNLGTLYLDARRLDDAERVFHDVLAQRREIFGDHHPRVAHILHNLGSLEDKRGNHRDAVIYYREAVGILEETLGADDQAVATALVALGEAQLELGEAAQALPTIERALAIDEAKLGPDHPEVAWDLNALAHALVLTQSWTRARDTALRAIAIREKHSTPDRVGQSRMHLAKALAGMGELADARAAAAQARADYAAEPHVQAMIDAWVAGLAPP